MRKWTILFITLLTSQSIWAMPNIQHWLTENGARVYFVAAPELDMVDIHFAFDAGSARDGRSKGLAMLANGLLNEGSQKLSADQIAEKFSSLGAQYSNKVDRDMSIVGLRSLSDANLLQPAVKLLATLVAKPDFNTTAFERVRQQMLANLQLHQQTPGKIASKNFYQLVYGEHPYASQAEGEIETVQRMTQVDVQDFHQQYYVAKNAVIAMVGNLSDKQAKQIAELATAQLPKGEKTAPLPEVMPLTKENISHINYPSVQTHILVGQPGMKRGEEDYFTLYVGNYILGGSGFASRILSEVREKRGLAYSAYSYFMPFKELGPFIAGSQTRGDQAETTITVLKQTLSKFTTEGPTDEELNRAKKGITGSFPLKIKSNKNIINYLAVIGFYNLPLDYLSQFSHHIEGVTVDKIKDAFQQRLKLDKLVTVTVGGQN